MKHRLLSSLTILLPALLLLSGVAHAAEADAVKASHAWIRVLPGDLPAGAYATLENRGDTPVTLTGASSAAYGHVMLHQSSTEGGMARMSMVDRLVVPAGATVALAPGGYHLMLMHANRPVTPGTTVTVTLQFADGSSMDVGFLARPANASP